MTKQEFVKIKAAGDWAIRKLNSVTIILKSQNDRRKK